jgi:3-phosphoshikimate 1-carboxyvinyltransferase
MQPNRPGGEAVSTFTVTGGRPLRGRITVPGDKSISHRALIFAALAEGTSVVRGLSDGDDVARTRSAIQAMGATVDGDTITGGRSRMHEPGDVLDMGNSGTGIRLLAGLCAGFPWLTVLTGDDSIRGRPMYRVLEPLWTMGARIYGRGGGRFAPLAVVGGGLHGIDIETKVASAQVKSAILLAGLSADGETTVRQSVATRAHTEELLTLAGADVEVSDGGRRVRLRPAPLQPFGLDVAGDPSQAAFWIVAACIVPGSDVTVEQVYLGTARDEFLGVLARMGADVEIGGGAIRARYSPDLHGTEVGGGEVPGLIDEIPALAMAAAVAEGETTFGDANELRIKESDRIATITEGLTAMGAAYELTNDGFIVCGSTRLAGARVQSHADHRIAMALAVAGLAAEGTTTIDGWEAVATSYPGFEADLERLCGS